MHSALPIFTPHEGSDGVRFSWLLSAAPRHFHGAVPSCLVVYSANETYPPSGPSFPPSSPLSSRTRGVVVSQEELRVFLLAIASRHADLAYLSRDGRLLYVDTVLVILFYEFRCV